MATADLSLQTQTRPRLLILNQEGSGAAMTVQEIPEVPAMLPLQAACAPVKLDEWLVAQNHCPCGPRRCAETELARKVEELAQSNRDLEQFAFVASHDLQEPLRMVAAYTQLLAQKYKGKLDADADKYIAYASSGAMRLQTLIRDLLEFSRVGRADKVCRPVDVNCALRDALHNLSQTILEAGAVIDASKLPVIRADRSQLTQVFQNLIGNAIKFRSEKSPVISIRCECAGPYHLFSVTDNGIGIAQHDAERVFVIFQRLHARAEYPGNGIGLAICRRIVERVGGRIWLESSPGEGATFKFTLPVVTAEPAGEKAKQETGNGAMAACASRG